MLYAATRAQAYVHDGVQLRWFVHTRRCLVFGRGGGARVGVVTSSPGAGKMPAEEALTRTTPPRARMLDTASAAPSTTAPRLMADMRRQSACPGAYTQLAPTSHRFTSQEEGVGWNSKRGITPRRDAKEWMIFCCWHTCWQMDE